MLLGTADVVLACLTIFLQFFQSVFGVSADIANRNLGIFRFAFGLLDVFLRRSSVNCGSGTRITWPSVDGLTPRSESRMAFSIWARTPLSNGLTMINRASGD
jgi:hypothetical protein